MCSCVTAPNLEKVCAKAGPEFGMGKWFIVVRALSGVKSAAASFRAFVVEKLDNAGFRSSVWMRPAVKDNGDECCHECRLMHVDDSLSISLNTKENPMAPAETGAVKHSRKEREEPTTSHLGHKLMQKQMDEQTVWTTSSVDHVNACCIEKMEQ